MRLKRIRKIALWTLLYLLVFTVGFLTALVEALIGSKFRRPPRIDPSIGRMATLDELERCDPRPA